ncbi:MAG: glycoside hydrolase family 97 protein [Pseudomonadota bacterium]
MRRGWFILLLVAAMGHAESVSSPDGRITVTVTLNDAGAPRYGVTFGETAVVSNSALGLAFADAPDLAYGFEITSAETHSADSTWEQPWGERRVVRDHYNELVLTLAAAAPDRELVLRIRAHNDGVGLRYEVPEQPAYDALIVSDELTEFRMPSDARAWWIPGRGWNRYEFHYNDSVITDLTLAHTPATFRLADGVHVALHEAALVDYPAYVLEQRGFGALKTNLTPWSNGDLARVSAPFVTPWRTIHLAADAIGLINSDLLLNLNAPNVLGDVSWVRPGKYVGIWWEMHLDQSTWGSGDRHGATTENAKRYIDFAANHGFDGVLVEGWNTGWDGNWTENGAVFSFTEAYPDFDLDGVARYALERGVRLIGHHETSGHVGNYESQLDDALDLYERLGVTQIKTGYVANGGDLQLVDNDGETRREWHDGQFGVGHYLRVLEAAAKRRISINTHEPVKDTGLRRTYPNWITREGARGQEYNAAWAEPNALDHNATLVYTRFLSGPMDFTPGIFDLTHQGPDSTRRVQSTLAHQLALYVVFYSPVQMAADLPENYLARSDAFQFIQDVPADWEDSTAIAGSVGEYLVQVRRERGGDDWYLGGITDASARDVSVALEFLQPDARYEAQIYADGVDAHWQSAPYAVAISSRTVTSGETLDLRMAAGGGVAVRFRRLSSDGD